MKIRTYDESDLEALKRMHEAQGFAYNFPDVNDPRFAVKVVVENGEGQPCMAALLRLTTEAYLLMDKGACGTPNQRWERLVLLHEVVRTEAERLGIEDVHAFLPEELPEGFFRRLRRLGWTEENWRCMWRPVERTN